MSAALRALAHKVVPDALLAPLLKRRFFATQSWANRHWGVFESFAEANQCVANEGKQPHFTLDHAAWLEEHQRLKTHDYPMLHWLTQILDGRAARIVDLGGSIGATYYAYDRYTRFPPGLQWHVCELPEAVEEGRRIAQERGATALEFSSDLESLEGADILFAAGAVQYIETPVTTLLAGLRKPPRHVLINKLPLTSQRAGFVTLQHSGKSASPYHIANHHAFVKSMAALGYKRRDHWKCLENFTSIPLHPHLTLPHFHGFYFERDGVE